MDFFAWFEDWARFGAQVKGGPYSVDGTVWTLQTVNEMEHVACPLTQTWDAAIAVGDAVYRVLGFKVFIIPVLLFTDTPPNRTIKECERQGALKWTSNRGNPCFMALGDGWLTVREALQLLEPDRSWMTDPTTQGAVHRLAWPALTPEDVHSNSIGTCPTTCARRCRSGASPHFYQASETSLPERDTLLSVAQLLPPGVQSLQQCHAGTKKAKWHAVWSPGAINTSPATTSGWRYIYPSEPSSPRCHLSPSSMQRGQAPGTMMPALRRPRGADEDAKEPK